MTFNCVPLWLADSNGCSLCLQVRSTLLVSSLGQPLGLKTPLDLEPRNVYVQIEVQKSGLCYKHKVRKLIKNGSHGNIINVYV